MPQHVLIHFEFLHHIPADSAQLVWNILRVGGPIAHAVALVQMQIQLSAGGKPIGTEATRKATMYHHVPVVVAASGRHLATDRASQILLHVNLHRVVGHLFTGGEYLVTRLTAGGLFVQHVLMDGIR